MTTCEKLINIAILKFNMRKNISLSKIIHQGFTTFSKDWQNYISIALIFITIPYALIYFTPQTNIWTTTATAITALAILGMQLSIIFIASRTNKKKTTSYTQLKKHLKKKYLPFVGTSLLNMLLIMVGFIPFLIIASIINTLMGTGVTPIILGVILLGAIIVGIASTYLVFTTIIVALKKESYFAAIKKSYEIIRKHFWKSVGYFIIIQLIATIGIILLNIVFTPLLTISPTTAMFVLAILQSIIVIPSIVCMVSWYQHE